MRKKGLPVAVTVSLIAFGGTMLTVFGPKIWDKAWEKPIPVTYFASVNSDKYHLPECKWAKAISKDNLLVFHSREDAEKRGYKPCKVCQP